MEVFNCLFENFFPLNIILFTVYFRSVGLFHSKISTNSCFVKGQILLTLFLKNRCSTWFADETEVGKKLYTRSILYGNKRK